jgi:hypothetical protein
MSDVIEASIDNWLASFDGRVLEIFTPYRQGSMRYHAALMVDCRIDGTTLTVDFQRREQGSGRSEPSSLGKSALWSTLSGPRVRRGGRRRQQSRLEMTAGPRP